MSNRDIAKKDAVEMKPMNLPWSYASIGNVEGVIEDSAGKLVVSNITFREFVPDVWIMHQIVRAVNCHDQLIAVLKKLEVAANTAQHCYDFRPENFAFAMSDLAEVTEEARAALALAEEKP